MTRLAQSSYLLDDRRRVVRELDEVISQLDGGLVPVVGEQALVESLRAGLDEVHVVMAHLADGVDVAGALDRLHALLHLPDWDVAATMLPELEQKLINQDATVAELEGRLREEKAEIDGLRHGLAVALRAGALVPKEADEVRVLDDLVKQAERALTERRYYDVSVFLHRLQESEVPGAKSAAGAARSRDDLGAALQAATTEAQALAGRAELLLLQGPPVDGRLEYTLLLRTGSGRGSHGVNVQASSTLVERDRSRVRALIDDVTVSVHGAARAARGRRELTEAAESEGAQIDDLGEHMRNVGELLYRLFVPESMHFLLKDGDGGTVACSLVLTTNDLELPWELMHDGRDFMCLQRPVGRLPMGRALPRETRLGTREAHKLRILLVCSDPHDNLPGAEREVDLISAGLREHWDENKVDLDVLTGRDANGDRFNEVLLSGRYDVIHYAGHAAFDRKDPDLSGLLLDGDEVLFAQKLRRLLVGQPLVFLNACESGRSANESTELGTGYNGLPAEGLASALVYGGALGCIGALWPVYDDAAAHFAVEFYNRVLEGHLVGEAMRRARRASVEQHGDQATWASFVLYGDPTFRLAEPSDVLGD